ncbi:MAG: hypothetical protein E6I03_06455 [Chloroflexi bacterium]|nr:MAG: hypothetical protein E6I03_06455 [Chloroflexota bacterium]
MSIGWDPRTIENASLVADLVEWIAKQPRSYADVLEAWRTSCPRFPVWEDAVDLGLVTRMYRGDRGEMIHASPAGLAFLRSQGRV